MVAPQMAKFSVNSVVRPEFQDLENAFDRSYFRISGRSMEVREASLKRLSTISLIYEDITMRTYDFSPLYRSAIGFDRLAQLFDQAQRSDIPSYPPYNIELVAEDRYRITMAVAGFDRSELDIETERDTLTIVGRKQKDENQRTFLHRGIAARDFEQRFQLADHVKVVSAQLDNGLLNIELAREVPEAMKPRKVQIGGDTVQVLEQRQAA
jgi:molecular chaperone IbpA